MNTDSAHIKDSIVDILRADLVPFIGSSPGCGKSDIIRSIAKEFNLYVIDMRLASKDPTDISGFPTLNMDRTRSKYSPPEDFPIEGDDIPKGYDGFLLFFDEMNSAPLSVQAACYQVILDRTVGQHNLHPKCKVIAAGNLATDKAIVNRMSTAMQSRMVHLHMSINLDAWLDWSYKADIDYRVRSFIKFRPELLQKFNPNHNDVTFACPRTWEFVSKLIQDWKVIPSTKLTILAGTVSEGVALEFMSYIEIMEDLPDFKKMLATPTTINIPDDPSIIHAMCGLIAHKATAENIETLMKLVNRFPKEFQVICLQDMYKHQADLLESKSVGTWIDDNAELLVSNY